MRNSLAALVALCLAAAARVPDTHAPAFEVASVKLAVNPGMVPMICLVPYSPGERLTVEGARVDIRYMSLSRLILTAYRLKQYQLSGPDWMKTQRFDILAKIPEGGSKDMVPEMLQSLLAERFKLAVHRENKEQPVYALVVGKNGQKLQAPAADADAPLPNAPGGRGLYTPGGEASVDANGNVAVTGGALGPMRGGRGSDGGMKMDMLKITMAGLAELLTPHEDRPVVDMTNLAALIVSLSRLSGRPLRETADGKAALRRTGQGDGTEAAVRAPTRRATSSETHYSKLSKRPA